MAEHAILSASGSKKWLTCTPSARLEETFPDETSEFAAEGTKAHDLMEIVAKYHYHGVGERMTPEELVALGYTTEMQDVVREFMTEAMKITEPLRISGKPFVVLVEQRLDYSDWVPKGFGTGDLVVVSGSCVWVRDLKYGKGVPVDSEDNTQMMLYGLGAYNELAMAYDDIREFDLGIVQPRINNNSSWRVTMKDLLSWGELIKPVAQKAWDGKGEFVPGPHCDSGFCRARFTCQARAQACLDESATLNKGETLTPKEIAALLPKLEGIEKWAKGLREYALKQAVDSGVRFDGYKLVEGKSNRYITDKKTAAVRLVANGFPQEAILSEPELIGITALEEVVGSKKVFTELLGDLIAKPVGKPTLVAVSDKRPEWKPANTADEDFDA